MKAIITVGPPACGKTTYAEEMREQGYEDINRDWIRFNIVCPGSDWSTYKFTKQREKDVSAWIEDRIQGWASINTNIVLSDTFLNKTTRENMINLCESLGYEVEIKDDWEFTFEELLKRDRLRPNGVGQEVIWNMYKKWYEYKGLPKYVPNNMLPEAYTVDLDGTLAKMNGRSPYDWNRVGEDSVRSEIANIVTSLWKCDYKIIILSGRDGGCYDITEEWLNKHKIPYDELLMRKAGDNRKDAIIKQEIFFEHVAPYYNVLASIDDRSCMVETWDLLGIPTISVGNIHERF